jgi:hypothetical protein
LIQVVEGQSNNTRDFDREAEAVGMLIKLNERRKKA